MRRSNNGGTAQILTSTAHANSLGLGGGPDDALDTGTLLVSGPGSLQIEGVLGLANFGIGTLMILNGGVVNSGPSSIGGSTHFGGLPGVVTVDGAGSNWTTSQTLGVDGSLVVQNGGALVSDCSFVNGGVLIEGPGSTWTSGEIVVAPSTFASVTIRNGAVLTSDGLSLIGDGPFPGSVTVDGPDSRWNNDFESTVLVIGYGDLGILDITDGGVVSTFVAELAPNDGENGQVLVDGVGSEFNVRSALSVGGSNGINGLVSGGAGLAQIINGGSIYSTKTTIFGQGTIVDGGTLTTDLVGIYSGGVLSGNGIVSGDVDNAGEIALGDPLGTLAIGRNLTLDVAGKVVFPSQATQQSEGRWKSGSPMAFYRRKAMSLN